VEQGHAEGIIGVTGLQVELVNVEGLPALAGTAEITVAFYVGIAAGKELGILLSE
jgi:hypothetical protein